MKAGKGRRVSRPAPKVCLSTGTRRPTLARRVCPTGSRRHANPRRPTPSHFLRDLPARQVRAAFDQTSGTPSGPFSEDRSSPGFCRVGAKQQGVKPASIPPPPAFDLPQDACYPPPPCKCSLGDDKQKHNDPRVPRTALCSHDAPVKGPDRTSTLPAHNPWRKAPYIPRRAPPPDHRHTTTVGDLAHSTRGCTHNGRSPALHTQLPA